jgi:large subunit ribosomal protein L10
VNAEKQLLLDEVQDTLKGDSFLLAKYEKLTSVLAHDFRKAVFNSGGRVTMVKKRLLVKAATKIGITLDLKEDLKGHIAVVTPGEDSLQTIKEVFDFKKASDVISIVKGQFDGKTCSGSEVEALSKLPTKDVLRAQLLGLFVAPMAQTLAVMDALLTAPLHCLENKIKKDS